MRYCQVTERNLLRYLLCGCRVGSRYPNNDDGYETEGVIHSPKMGHVMLNGNPFCTNALDCCTNGASRPVNGENVTM